jgi:RNA polymerase sigma-32 factor
MAALTLPVIPIGEGLSRYFREAWKFPILEADEEYMLAKRWKEHEDVEAAHKLVTSHLRLVAKIAMRYRGYGLPVSDLVSEGNIGLMKAVKKFEPDKGFRLSTYAMWWIRAAITEYVLRSWSMVKMGTMAAQKKLFFSLRKQKNHLKIMDHGELSPEQVARISATMNVSERDVVDMNRRLASRDMSLNAPLGNGEEVGIEFQDILVDDNPSPEAHTAEKEELNQRMGYLMAAMDGLPERERHIFTERRLAEEPKTLEELGNHYGISRERVRQLEVRAFDKVRTAVEKAAGNAAPTA